MFLPLYKIAYSVFFIVLLSLIRGVTYTYEIGIAMEAPMAILTTVFCADTYMQEIISKRSEIHKIASNKKASLFNIGENFYTRDIFIVACSNWIWIFLCISKPSTHLITESEIRQLLIYLMAVSITIFFWEI